MRALTKTWLIAALCVLVLPLAAPAQEAKTLDQLLKEVREGRARDQEINRKREAEFQSAKGEQARLLSQMQAEQRRQEARSEQLEAEFQQNEVQIAALGETLRNRLGSLGELFGVVRQVAGDTKGVVNGSMTSAQFPGRGEPLGALGESKELPTTEKLRELWFLLQQEMTESGKSTRFTADVVTTDGTAESMEVVRAGVFTAISGGEFLKYDPIKTVL
jgi:biopolymer transport protein ExbB